MVKFLQTPAVLVACHERHCSIQQAFMEIVEDNLLLCDLKVKVDLDLLCPLAPAIPSAPKRRVSLLLALSGFKILRVHYSRSAFLVALKTSQRRSVYQSRPRSRSRGYMACAASSVRVFDPWRYLRGRRKELPV